jgi:hypothetical protein
VIGTQTLDDFSVTRTREWPTYVAPAKNNFICESIVKRDKRMRDAGLCAGRISTNK